MRCSFQTVTTVHRLFPERCFIELSPDMSSKAQPRERDYMSMLHKVGNFVLVHLSMTHRRTAVLQKRLYSRKNIQDLIDQTIIEQSSTSGSNAPPSTSQQTGERPFLERLKGRPSGRPKNVFGDELSQISLEAFGPRIRSSKSTANGRNMKTRGARGPNKHIPEEIVEAEMSRFQDLGEERRNTPDWQEDALRNERGKGQNRSRRRTFRSSDAPSTSEAIPLETKPAVPKRGGLKRGPKGKSKRALLLGEGEEEQAEGHEDLEIGQEEFWDVDADTMRVVRQMMAWRNPVTADEPGEPALFHRIKSGYDVYAEERTQFRLNDTSATWSSNGPTTSHPDMLGGQKGDYSAFMPEQMKRLAEVDTASMKPADVVRFSLTRAVDIPPRQRENVVSAVEDFLSSATAPQNRQVGR
jgi:hypothetical protein